jgi:hypothetical protein
MTEMDEQPRKIGTAQWGVIGLAGPTHIRFRVI